MRVLVIGGAGFIGAHLVRQLLQSRYEVGIFDCVGPAKLTDSGSVVLKKRVEALSGSSWYIGDAATRRDLEEAVEIFDPECIYYLAALPIIDQVTRNPFSAVPSMLSGLVNSLDVVRLRLKETRFIYISSSMVYGRFACDPLPETAPTIPSNTYGAFKLAGEVLTRSYLSHTSHTTVVVRPTGVYGPGDVHGRVVQKCCEAAVCSQPFILRGSGSTLIDFTWVDDLVAGLVLLATAPGAAGETFNLAFGHAHSLEELVAIVARYGGGLRVERALNSDPYRPRRGTLDIGKAERILGFKPQVDLEQGIMRYISTLKALSI